MSDDLTAAITTAEAQLQSTIDEMQVVQQQFVSCAADFIQPWYWTTAQEVARSNPEVTKGLGREKLATLKNEVQALQERASVLTAAAFDDDELWWHRKPREDLYYYRHGERLPNPLDDALRRAAGQLAPLLQKYGYLDASWKDNRFGSWRESAETRRSHSRQLQYSYRGMLATPPDSIPLVTRYSALRDQARKEQLAVDAAKRAKEQSEAQDLWDQA